MKISVKKERFGMKCFEGEEYIVDLDRRFEGYEKGDIVISGTPFDGTGKFPLTLEIAIRKNGCLVFRSWSFNRGVNPYFHINSSLIAESFTPTIEQLETVAGLFSGRITFEGLKINIGASVQEVCPIDLKAEEERLGKKIYLNYISTK